MLSPDERNSPRGKMEDAIWDLATRCENDATKDPFPKFAKARQDELFEKAMAIFDEQAEALETARADFKRESWAHAEYVVAMNEALRKANEALTTHHAFIEHLRDNGYSAADGELCEKFLRKHPTPTGDLGKANATDSCVVEPYNSRMCERGTKACSVRHPIPTGDR